MSEYFIVYDIASGEERWRGGGPTGTAAQQQLPIGMGVIAVPQAAIATVPADMSVIKTAGAATVDTAAEAARQTVLTPGSGQALVYQHKAAEAAAYAADNGASTPFLSAEAAARGMTVAAVADEVTAQVAKWTIVGPQIEAARMVAKAALTASTNISEIVAAITIDWTRATTLPA